MIVPARITKDVADAFVGEHHRHHDPDQGCRYVVGAWDATRSTLCGVDVVGRPRARSIDQQGVVEVTRCATDGTKNACSFIYARAASIAKDYGFRAIITYTLASEGGASLRALGWWSERLISDDGRTFANRPGREDGIRADWRWLCLLNEDCHVVEMTDAPDAQLDLLEVA